MCLQSTLQYCRTTKASSDKASLDITSHAGTLVYYFCQTNCRSSQQGCGSVVLSTNLALNELTWLHDIVGCHTGFSQGARGMYMCSSPANIACFLAGVISSHRVQHCGNCSHFFWFLDKIFRNLFLNMI